MMSWKGTEGHRPISEIPLPVPNRPKLRQTSLDAAESIKPDKESLQSLVYSLLVTCPNGRTCDEIEVSTRLSHQTASARIRELFLAGKIEDSGMRRATRSGRTAIVWVAARP